MNDRSYVHGELAGTTAERVLLDEGGRPCSPAALVQRFGDSISGAALIRHAIIEHG